MTQCSLAKYNTINLIILIKRKRIFYNIKSYYWSFVFRINWNIYQNSMKILGITLWSKNGNSIRRTYNDTRHRSNVCCQLHVRIPKRVHQSCVQICFIFRRSGIFLFMYKSSSVEVVLLRIVTPSMSFCCLLCRRSFLQVSQFGTKINA